MTTKTCPKCKIEKDVAAFDLTGFRQPKRVCRDCSILLAPMPKTEHEKLVTNVPAQYALVPLPRLTGEEKLDDVVNQRMQLYRCAAMDALFDLAMMKMTDNSMMMQVKYLAAVKLVGNVGGEAIGAARVPQLEGTLKELNKLYHENAPRVKSIREREINFDNGETIVVPT